MGLVQQRIAAAILILGWAQSIVCGDVRGLMFPPFPAFPSFPSIPLLPSSPAKSGGPPPSAGGGGAGILPDTPVSPGSGDGGAKLPHLSPSLNISTHKGPSMSFSLTNSSSMSHVASLSSFDGGAFTAKLKEVDGSGKMVEKNISGSVVRAGQVAEAGNEAEGYHLGKFKNATSEGEIQAKVVSGQQGVAGGAMETSELSAAHNVHDTKESGAGEPHGDPSKFGFSSDEACRGSFGTGTECTKELWETCKAKECSGKDQQQIYCMKSGKEIYKCHLDCMRGPCGVEGCLDEDKIGKPESKIENVGKCTPKSG